MKSDKSAAATWSKKARPGDLTGQTALSVRRSLKWSFEWPLPRIPKVSSGSQVRIRASVTPGIGDRRPGNVRKAIRRRLTYADTRMTAMAPMNGRSRCVRGTAVTDEAAIGCHNGGGHDGTADAESRWYCGWPTRSSDRPACGHGRVERGAVIRVDTALLDF